MNRRKRRAREIKDGTAGKASTTSSDGGRKRTNEPWAERSLAVPPSAFGSCSSLVVRTKILNETLLSGFTDACWEYSLYLPAAREVKVLQLQCNTSRVNGFSRTLEAQTQQVTLQTMQILHCMCRQLVQKQSSWKKINK